MSTGDFMKQLRSQDVRVWADGDRVRVNAPRSVLTPDLQAELVARKAEIRAFLAATSLRRSCLVPIHASGSRPTFYGVPSDGDVFDYVELARRLGPDQPFYAFEAPGIDGVQRPMTSIESLAAYYLSDLKAFQPNGPYFIGGFCLGGIVAFELARQLDAQGQDVGLLALFESPSPEGFKAWHRPAARVRRRQTEILARMRWLARRPWSERLAFGRSRLDRVLGRRHPMDAIGEPKRRVFHATQQAACAYVRKRRTHHGRMVLFLCSPDLKRRRADLRQFEWARAAAGGFEVKVGPDSCTDYLLMLRDPHVGAIADLLKPYIR
jgi:thioesterase domain-containing protein